MITADPAPPGATAAPRRPTAGLVRWLWWAAVPFAAVYLILLAINLGDVINNVNLDADAVSAPVIGQLFGSAPGHANVVLGTFGWYSTLLFELATKWLPGHREVWVGAPYVMALGGAVAVAWAVWRVAGRFAASLSLVLLVCAAPITLRLLLSMTQHAPVWFCLAVLSAWLVLIHRPGRPARIGLMLLLALVVGAVVGINAASDPLVTVAGLVPFALALLVTQLVAPRPLDRRALLIGLATLLFAGAFWGATLAGMSALNVGPEPGLDTTTLAYGPKIGSNFGLWLRSIAVLGNGDFFGQSLSFTSLLAILCAALCIAAVLLLPRLGWTAVREGIGAQRGETSPARLAFLVCWCSSALLLTAAFLVSSTPVDIHAARYLVGLIYAAAAVIPVIASRRAPLRVLALVGTCLIALAAVISMAQGVAQRNTEGFPSPQAVEQIATLAAREHVQIGYSGYWDASPITWSTHFRVRVFPVSICDQGKHLCRFDLHYISSWYEPHHVGRSFLLADPSLRLVPAPTRDLGRPSAVYHVGAITMYVYPYDLATRIVTPGASSD